MAELKIGEKLYMLFIFIYNQLYHLYKAVLFKLTGLHEVQRICKSKYDIFTKTHQIENWLGRTNSYPIKQSIARYTDPDGDNLISKQLLSYLAKSKLSERSSQSLKEESSENTSKIDQTNVSDSKHHPNKHPLDRVDSISMISFLCSLSSSLEGAVDETYTTITRQKNMGMTPFKSRMDLKDALYRIITYKQIELLVNQLASTKYDSKILLHSSKLTSLWNHLFPNEPIDDSNLISNKWLRMGFQGDDPGTDFRGMGLLGLFNLEYLAKHRNNVAKNLLKDNMTKYPFAIVGINLTYALFNLIKNGNLKDFFYDDKNFKRFERCNTLMIVNELYVELFLRFDWYWAQRSPNTIMVFNSIMEDFVVIIQEDLKQRNFSIKFIYDN